VGVPFHHEQIQEKGLKSTGKVKDKGDFLWKKKKKREEKNAFLSPFVRQNTASLI